MKDTLKAGITQRSSLKVGKGRTISFMGEALRVYSTPSIVTDVEYACLDLLDKYCDDSESSVGARVEVSHDRPTPLGATIFIDITVASVEGALVTFDAVVADDIEQVARARHIRAVVDKARLEKAVTAKAKKLKSGK